MCWCVFSLPPACRTFLLGLFLSGSHMKVQTTFRINLSTLSNLIKKSPYIVPSGFSCVDPRPSLHLQNILLPNSGKLPSISGEHHLFTPCLYFETCVDGSPSGCCLRSWFLWFPDFHTMAFVWTLKSVSPLLSNSSTVFLQKNDF